MNFGPADLTGWCSTNRHQRCDGSLHAGTGYHWYCICDCHPEPPASSADAQKAHETWQRARAAAT